MIWDEHTRAYIQEVIAGAQEEAEKIVQKELKETNLFPWFKKNSEIFSSYNSLHSRDSAFGVLSNIVDTKDMKVPFAPAPEIKFNRDPAKVLWPLKPRSLYKTYGSYNNKLGKREEKMERPELQSWGSIDPESIYLMNSDSRASKVKDLFLYQLHDSGTSPVLFQLMTNEEIEKMVDNEIKDAQQLVLKNDKVKGSKEANKLQKLDDSRDDKIAKRKAYRDKLWSLLKKDETFEIKDYDEVEVPKTFEEKAEAEEAEATLTPAEKRALENRVVLYTPYETQESYGTYTYKMTKREPKIKTLNDIGRETIYGVQKDDPLLQMFAMFRHNDNPALRPKFFPEEPSKIIEEKDPYPFIARFSKRNLKYIKDNPKFKKAEDMVWKNDQKEISVGDYFIPFFTAKFIKERLHKLKFFSNFRDLNEELSEAYVKIRKYVNKNYNYLTSNRLENQEYFKEFHEQAQKAIEAQLELRGVEDKDDRKAIIKKFFPDAPDTVERVIGLDLRVMEVLEELEDYSEPVKKLFNEIPFLTESKPIPDEVSRLLSGVIESENLDKFNLTENTINNIENI